MAEIFFSKSSSTFNPDKVPLSYAPRIRYPFFLELGKSLEKAHIAYWNLSISPVDTVRSILYVSVLVKSSRTSSFDIMLFLLLILYQTLYYLIYSLYRFTELELIFIGAKILLLFDSAKPFNSFSVACGEASALWKLCAWGFCQYSA